MITTLVESKYLSRIQTEDKIQAFGHFRAGWSHAEGVPFARLVIEQAAGLAQLSNKLGLRTDAFPGLDGEIMVVIYRKNYAIELTVEVDGTVTFYRDDDNDSDGEPEHGLTLDQAVSRIVTLQLEEECDLSGYWTHYTTTYSLGDLKASPSKDAQFQYFSPIVQFKPVERSARISIASIKTTREPLHFFGSSNLIYFPEARNLSPFQAPLATNATGTFVDWERDLQ